MAKLEIKSIEGKILFTIEEKEFNQSRPLVFFLTTEDKTPAQKKVDIKYLRSTGSGKLVLN